MKNLILEILNFIITLPYNLYNYFRIFFIKQTKRYKKFTTGTISEVHNVYASKFYIIKDNNNNEYLYFFEEAMKFKVPRCFRDLYIGEKVRFKQGYKKKIGNKKYNIVAYIEPFSDVIYKNGYLVHKKQKDTSIILTILVKMNGEDKLLEKKLDKDVKPSKLQFGSYCKLVLKENTTEIIDIKVLGLVNIKDIENSDRKNMIRSNEKSPVSLKLNNTFIYNCHRLFCKLYFALKFKKKNILATTKKFYENGDILFVDDLGKEYIYSSVFQTLSNIQITRSKAYPNSRVKIFETGFFKFKNKKSVSSFSMVADDNNDLKDIFKYDYFINSFIQEHGKVKDVSTNKKDGLNVSFSENGKLKNYNVPYEKLQTNKKRIQKNDECFILINKIKDEVIFCSVLENKDELPDLNKFIEKNTSITIQ